MSPIIPRPLRYLNSFVGEISGHLIAPIVLCRLARFGQVILGNWHFYGPPEFLHLVCEADERLHRIENSPTDAMEERYLVFYNPKRGYSLTPWNIGAIDDHFLAWKVDGIIAAWLYLHFHAAASKRVGRWALTAYNGSSAPTREARANTKARLVVHNFPEALCDAFSSPEVPTASSI